MNHAKMRRIALTVAAISLSTLTSLLLIGTCLMGNFTSVSAKGASCVDIKHPKGNVKMMEIPISCTSLVIENLCAYDGNFVEDDSGREVQDVAAIVIRNTGDTAVPFACVTVYTEKCRYAFEAYMIPPKSSLLVPEINAQKLTQTNVIRTFGWTTVQRQNSPKRLSIEEVGMSSLRVTNRSGSKIKDLTLYHKTYIPEEGFYMGGKAFKTHISYIAPGESVIVHPSNYASGYSKVIYYE